MTPFILSAMLLAAAPNAGEAAPERPAAVVAPQSIPHGTALFLAGLSEGGQRRVTFKAAAVGTRFFFEEPAGVSVYVYSGNGYRREAFLHGQTLERALKKYEFPRE